MVLNNASINDLVSEISRALLSGNLKKERRLQVQLAAEEILLRYRDNGFEGADLSFKIVHSFFTWKVIIRIKGEERDLTVDAAEASGEYDDLLKSFLSTIDCQISHGYRNGENVITFTADHAAEKKSFLIKNPIPAAVILAAVFSVAAKLLLNEWAALGAEVYIAPLNSVLMDVLKSVTVFYTFTSLVCSLVAMDNMKRLSTVCGKAILRFFLLTSFIILLSMGVCLLFFSTGGDAGGGFVPGTIFRLLLDIIPVNPVEAFLSRNMIQIIFIAFLFGIAILALGDKARGIRTASYACNEFMEYMMKLVSKLIPPMIFLSICNAVITTEFSAFLGLWKCIAPMLVIGILVSALALGEICIRFRQPLGDILRRIRPAVGIALATASSSVAIPKMFEMAKKDENGNSGIASYFVPLSFSMFAPSSAFSLVVFAFFAAEQSGAAITPITLIFMFIMVLELSFATPKIPGGIMATTTLLLTQLGIGTESVGLMMAANVFLVNFAAGVVSLLRCTELIRAELTAQSR